MTVPSKPLRTRILGVDFGFARIGLAISDEQKIITTALETLQSSKSVERAVVLLVQFLEKLTRDRGYNIERIVVGLPLKINGTSSERTEACKKFAELLEQSIQIPVTLWDERLTTIQADRSLQESNFSRKKRARFVDAVSAIILLQSFLDSRAK